MAMLRTATPFMSVRFRPTCPILVDKYLFDAILNKVMAIIKAQNMATTDEYIKYDIRFWKEFSKYLNYDDKTLEHLEQAVHDGLIQRDRLVELAVSRVSGIATDSKVGQDLADASDVKSVVSNGRNNNKTQGQWTNSYKVPRVDTKVGALRVVAYNKILDTFNYFFIPYEAYRNISSVEIIIEYATNYDEHQFTGLPNKTRKWWQYEVDSFEDLCLKVPKENLLQQNFINLFGEI